MSTASGRIGSIGLNKEPSRREVAFTSTTSKRSPHDTSYPLEASQKRHVEKSTNRASGIFNAGLQGAGSTSATNFLVDVVTSISRSAAATDLFVNKEIEDKELPSDAVIQSAKVEKPKKVGFFSLFSFATTNELWCMLLGTIMAGIAGLAMPVWLLLLAQSLQTFNNIGKIIGAGGDISILSDELYKLIYSFALLGVVSLISGSTYVALWTYTGERQTLRIQQKFVTNALRQEMAWFDQRGDPQELPVLAANGLSKINNSIGRTVGDVLANLLSSIGCLAVSLWLDTSLALIMLCMMPIIAGCIGIISCYMRKSSRKAVGEFASAGAFATEVLTGIKTVASLCAEKWAVRQYKEHSMRAQKYSIQSQYLSKLAAGVMGLLFYFTLTWSFLFGTEQVARSSQQANDLPLGSFQCIFTPEKCGISGSYVMVCIYGIILTAQFFALMNPGINAINLGRTAATDIFDAIHRRPIIDISSDEKGIEMRDDYDGSMELKNVVFSYPTRPDDLIFKNFSLKIDAGMAVALVGPSGSGKSTLSKLLLRLYDPIGGQVLVGGTTLTELNLKSWRSQIGYVAQEPSLFPGTIRENIASGKETLGMPATDAEVQAAAKAASAHEFIMELPDGYDTFYSGSSIQLSGGQIQRIAIARAMIRNPKILLLDEATSALDTASERMVQDALDLIRTQRKLTTVTVAHRLSTIVNSDKIAVIAEGAIQELGTHKELFALGGIYAQLCEGQGLRADAAEALKVSQDQTLTKEGGAKTPETVVEEQATATKLKANKGDIEEARVEEIDEGINTKGVLGRLWDHNKDEKWYMILGYAGGIVAGLLPPSEGVLFGLLTNNLLFENEEPERLRELNQPLSLWFLLLAGASFLANVAMGIGFGVSGFRLTRRMRVLVFDRIIRHSMGWFDFPQHSTGELTTRLEEDAEAVSNVTGWQQGQRIQTFTCLSGGMIVALSFSWQIGLIAMSCVPFILGAGILQASCAGREPVREDDGKTVSPATLLERSFHDVIVLQAYNLQDKVSQQYCDACVPDAAFKKKQGCYSGLAFGFSQFSIFSTFALIFWAGIKLMVRGEVGFVDFFVALLSVMFSAFGAGQTGADFSSRRAGLEAGARLFEIVEEDMDQDDPLDKGGDKLQKLSGKVEFKACHFAYPTRPEAPVYYQREDRDGFTLDIPSKESVAFTGRSGCGKSTALQLLLRFYRVSSGSVNLDGESIYKLNMAWLRGTIGYVGQMPVLFNGSIRDNIKLGKSDATEDEIISAAKAANAHDFISKMSNGYDTQIGAGGSLLSGGQKQRIAIARAIVKDPQILVLDEATSALDNESEKIVQAALDDMQQKHPRTTLVVAHRLETVKKCDKIVVLDRGGVKEQGSHQELLSLHGLYHSLWTKQGGKED